MDFLATKGLEYLLVLLYLALLVPFWHLLVRAGGVRGHAAPAPVRIPERPWFTVPAGFHFHPGHTWAVAEADDLVRVGMDDFAHRLLGPVDAVELPRLGTRLEAGSGGWSVRLNGDALDVLSPVSGEVAAVNQRVAETPANLPSDPYETGWLLKIRVRSAGTALKNLMPEPLARLWTDAAAEELSSLMGEELGVVLQDGGVPMPGLAMHLAGSGWRDLAARALLSGKSDADSRTAGL